MRVPGCGGGGSGGCGTVFSPSSWVAKAGKSLESEDSLVYRVSSRMAWPTESVPGGPPPHPKNKNNTPKKKNPGGRQGMKMSVGVVV